MPWLLIYCLFKKIMMSRNKSLALFLIISIFLACGFLYVLNISHEMPKEGFNSTSLEAKYTQLQSSLERTLEPYCSLANFIQDQMTTMYKATKVSESGESVPGDSDSEALENIRIAYEKAYACKDELAESRPSCAGFAKLGQINVKMNFIPCSVYMNTPTYDDSDTSSAAIALSEIPDNLALRITKEVEWYAAIIKKLQDGLDVGAKPPANLPPGAPGADYKKEGFFAGSSNAKCSPEAMRLRKQRMLQAESESCTMPNLQTEIDRVNGILNSDALKKAVASCATVSASAKKLQSQLALLKSGSLYDWQMSGPKKSYAEFKGGDRIAGLTFSLQQNR